MYELRVLDSLLTPEPLVARLNLSACKSVPGGDGSGRAGRKRSRDRPRRRRLPLGARSVRSSRGRIAARRPGRRSLEAIATDGPSASEMRSGRERRA